MTPRTIHPEFRLNGLAFSFEDLREVGYSLVKEGKTYEIAIGNFLMDWVDTKNSVMVSTSGSTGVPKKIAIKKQQMLNSALATGRFFDLKPSNTALLCLPADYIAGKMMLVRAMVLGLRLDCVLPESNPLTGKKKQYDFAAMIPLQVENSLEKLDRISTLIVGGAPMSNNLIAKVQQKQTQIYETYGMTETVTHIAAKKVNHHGLEKTNFKALPSITLSTDNRDCLVINAPAVAQGDVITNDVVHLISETEFEWLGRYDTIINSGGIKLNPESIEAKLAMLIDLPYFIAGIPDAVLGEKLVLIVEGNTEIGVLAATLKEFKSLHKFEIPKEIYSLDKFIRTENGKIQRAKTLALLAQ